MCFFSHCYLPKCMQNLLYGKMKRNFQKVVFWVFEHVRQQNAKKYENHPIQNIHSEKRAFWEFLSSQRTKKVKLMEIQIILTKKKQLFWVFDLVMHKKYKMHEKYYIYRETKTQYKQHVLWVFFLSFLPKRENAVIQLYIKK